jgi:DNA repair protein RecO (recombination protein O)
VGYALDLDRCVQCGKPCPAARPAFIDAARGGLVCSACGGGRMVLPANLRAIARAAQRGGRVPMTGAQADEILGVVELAMAAHTGLET